MVALRVSVDVAVEPEVNVTDGGVREVTVRPEAGDTEEVSATVPAKPFVLVTLMVEVPVAPIAMVKAAGAADMVKSGMKTVTVVAPELALFTTSPL